MVLIQKCEESVAKSGIDGTLISGYTRGFLCDAGVCCVGVNLLFHRRPLQLASSSSWWWWIRSSKKKNKLFNIHKQIFCSWTTARLKITNIHWTQKMTQELFMKPGALIPIKLSRSDPKRSIRANRRVLLSGSQFLQKPARHFVSLLIKKNGLLPS